ncbi:DMT family transporter [Paeniglutamicibacter cryotolerans]|uniref:Drug/metabolite transporter (DMT)-like permease n=1 Tax=Paeniglutamicibacter cryotolerans TaxID=670079 RepID=A0A839QLQ5_9MICC|nr:DMT family transporter [Paeniglutamicibacter cryotolerans]MBB2994946.1 drug/metabolite transporter (DMT)-like permease [Paeniglutamicibacter cryotolerans]
MMYLLALIGVLGVSASGPIVAAFPSVPALSMALWRNALGTAVMAAPVLVRDPRSFGRLRRREWGWSAAAALSLALHFACFMTSIRMTSVAAATALVCLQAAWIALFQTLQGVRYGWRVGAGSLLAVAGVIVITGFDLGGSSQALTGDLLAILGGVLAASYTLCGAKARESMGTGTYTSLCYGMTAAVLLVMCLALGEPLWGFGVKGWIGIIALAICAQVLGHSVFNHLLSSMGPLTVSTLVLFEIPGAAILAAVFLGQELPAGTVVGLVIILAGLYFVVRGQVPRKAALSTAE